MEYRKIFCGFIIPATLLILAACQGTATLPVIPTSVPAPTNTPVLLTLADQAPDLSRSAEPESSPQPTPIVQVSDTPAPTVKPTATQRPLGAPESMSNNDSGGTGQAASASTTGANVIWLADRGTWAANGTAPSCPEPFVLQTPVDMSKVTGALWPGQARGNDYKGHGGFSFNEKDTESVIVTAPIGSHLVQAAKYLESDQEQILLFFSVPCGYSYRFDHVRGLSPKVEEALQAIPTATAGDSRTTVISPPLWVEQGEVVATSVGLPNFNIFVDFGLYDVRKPNNVTPNPAWADLFAKDVEFGQYGVCFFDYLPGSDGATMRSFPTGIEGPTSDYC